MSQAADSGCEHGDDLAHLGDPLGQVECIKQRAEAYLKTPEGQAEVEEIARSMRDDDQRYTMERATSAATAARDAMLHALEHGPTVEYGAGGGIPSAAVREILRVLRGESSEMVLTMEQSGQQTTEGITRADVDEAMAFMGMHNPKPEIPLEVTVSGHEIVATARRVRRLEAMVFEMADKMGVTPPELV